MHTLLPTPPLLHTLLLLLHLNFPTPSTAANITSLTGTWASKSWPVFTGPGFYDPQNDHLYEPKLPGASYSFTDDMFFEEAIYITISNPTTPSCPRALLQYQIGTYSLPPNGSLVLHPFAKRGRQLLSEPCKYDNSVYGRWNETEVFKSWEVIEDPYRASLPQSQQQGVYRLNLWKWDGAPVNPLYRIDGTPRMNPVGEDGNVNEVGVGGGSGNGEEETRRRAVKRGERLGEKRGGLWRRAVERIVGMEIGEAWEGELEGVVGWIGWGMILVGGLGLWAS